MAGTKAGGIQAAKTNKAKYGHDFYQRIAAIGGRNGHTSGFYGNPALAQYAGMVGGTMSRRGSHPLSPAEKAIVRRRLARSKAYRQLQRVHRAAQRERELSNL